MRFSKIDDSRMLRTDAEIERENKLVVYKNNNYVIEEVTTDINIHLDKKNKYIQAQLNLHLYRSLRKYVKIDKKNNVQNKNLLFALLKQISINGDNDTLEITEYNFTKIGLILKHARIQPNNILREIKKDSELDKSNFAEVIKNIKETENYKFFCENDKNKLKLKPETCISKNCILKYQKMKIKITERANNVIKSIEKNNLVPRTIKLEKESLEKLLEEYQIDDFILLVKSHFKRNDIVIEEGDRLWEMKQKVNLIVRNRKSIKTIEKNKIIKKIFYTFQLNTEIIKNSWKTKKQLSEKDEINYIDDFVKEYLHKKFPVKNVNENINFDLNQLDKSKIKKFCEYKLTNKKFHNVITKNILAIDRDVRNSLAIEKNHFQNVFSRKLSGIIAYAGNSIGLMFTGEKDELETYISKHVNIESIIKKYHELGLDNEIIYNNQEIKGNEYLGIFNELSDNEKEKILEMLENWINKFNNIKIKYSDVEIKFTNENVDFTDEGVINIYVEENVKNNHKCEKQKKFIKLYNKIDNRKNSIEEISSINFKSYKECCEKKKDVLKESSPKSNVSETEFSTTLTKDPIFHKISDDKIKNQILKPFFDLRQCMIANVKIFRNASIHSKKEIEFKQGDNLYTNILKQHYKNRLLEQPKEAILRAYDNAVFSFFNEEEIMKYFEDNHFFFNLREIKTPSFKNIIAAMIHIQNDQELIKNNENFIEYLLNIKNPKENPKFQAQKFLTKILYDAEAKNISENIGEQIKEYIKAKKLEEVYSKYDNLIGNKIGETLDNFEKIETLEELTTNIQKVLSELEEKEISKNHRSKETNKAIKEMVNVVVLLKFLAIFKENKFIKGEIKENPVVPTTKNDLKNILDEKYINFKYEEYDIKDFANDDSMFGFYSLLLFLSKGRLSELNQILISYKRNCDKFGIEDKQVFEKFEVSHLIEMTTIVLNTYRSTDKMSMSDVQYEKFLSSCLEARPEVYNEIFKNNKETERKYLYKDQENLIRFYQIEEAFREDILGRYKKYYEKDDAKITIDEVREFNQLEKNISSMIENKEALKIKIKDKKKEENIKELKKKYTKLYESILKYNSLKNKILLTDIRIMNRLLIDIYGKLNGLISVYEKNLTIYCNDEMDKINVFKSLKQDDLKRKNIKLTFGGKSEEFDDVVRNYYAHFHYLSAREVRKDGAKRTKSFVQQLNYIRRLLRGDRKLKNAVTKSVVSTFEKHGFIITFEFNHEHNIKSYKLERKKVNDQNLYQYRKNEDYFIKMIEVFFPIEDS